MMGLGFQELLILGICAGVPVVTALVVLAVVLSQSKPKARPDHPRPDDDRPLS
jgi:hypothetical protein